MLRMQRGAFPREETDNVLVFSFVPAISGVSLGPTEERFGGPEEGPSPRPGLWGRLPDTGRDGMNPLQGRFQ